MLTQRLIAANRGGWEGDLPNMHIYSEGALKGFVSVVPRWCGYASEDYNRASLRAYGVEESELVRLGGAIETDLSNRGQQVMGRIGQKATESETFQYRTTIDSDDYTMFPETAGDMEGGEEDEQLSAFAEQVRKRQKELAEIGVDRRAYGPYNLSGCERVRAELFSVNDKACLTIDKNGIIFNSAARKKLGGVTDIITRVEIAYNPIMQMLIIRATDEDNERTLKWAVERQDKLTMRRCPCKGFSNALFDNMGWNLDYKYRLIGGFMVIDGQPVLVFTLEDPIKIVPIVKEKREKEEAGKKTKNRQTKELLEAGFEPEDFQMPSNLTYRLYDYDRVDKNGKKRELHIDKALRVAKLSSSAAPRQPMRVLKYRSGYASELLTRCKYFQVERVLLNTETQRNLVSFQTGSNSFHTLLCTDGCGNISWNDGDNGDMNFFKGDCIFVPAESVELKLHGKAQLINVSC